jgi:TRAP-type C4-dicarboxylate transport system permease small subunit
VSTAAAPTAPKRRHPFEYLIEVPAVIVTFLMMFHITANALLRTFWNAPMPDTLEITQYWYLPIVAFLGFIAAQHRGQHIAADLIFEHLPHRVRPAVLSLMFVLCALTAAGFSWYSWPEAMHSFDIRRTAGVSDLISWPTYFLPPIAFAVLTVQFAWAAFRAVTDPSVVEAPVVADLDDAVLFDEVGPSLVTVDSETNEPEKKL